MRDDLPLDYAATARLKDNLRRTAASPPAGSGIMLLNCQIKRRLPDLSIDDRSKMVTEIWSTISDEESGYLMSHASRGWICDPHRKEFSTNDILIDSYSRNALHRATLHRTIPFIQLASGGVVRTALLDRPTKNDKNMTAAARPTLQIIREVLADEVSKVSEGIPARYLKSESDTANSGRVRKVVERMDRRRKRLRCFAAKGSRNKDVSNTSNIEKCVAAIKDLACARKSTFRK